MGVMVNWRNLAIGTKVMGVTVLTVGLLLGAGAYFLGQKMQEDLVELLTGRAQVIEPVRRQGQREWLPNYHRSFDTQIGSAAGNGDPGNFGRTRQGWDL
jgi:hypothetical protein